MAATFAAMMVGDVALGLVVLDFPRADRCSMDDWMPVLDAVAEAQERSGKPVAVLATLVETLPEAVADACRARGIPMLCDLPAALDAVAAAAFFGQGAEAAPVLLPGDAARGAVIGARLLKRGGRSLTKTRPRRLWRAGVRVPARRQVPVAEAPQTVARIGLPVVVEAVGPAHTTEAGGVALNLCTAEAAEAAAKAMGTPDVLVEEMIEGAVAELLLGVVRDPAHGFVLSLGAGGVLTEVWQDTVSMLLPVIETEVRDALTRLRLAPVLAGWRGAPGADAGAIWQTVDAVQTFVALHASEIADVEINPLMCREKTPWRWMR
ncbi:acetate--CoA ligase family protein [Sagittula stellata]|uniref:Acyl-CoA synthetase, putative n=1 Tax=Sagittula stellata (strain ATCC 700073 / DSM 11524 / E-37) TaxID=388399 RepID=A3JZV0_SAGS3|nr:acyl-CoA synthetase, putative [Sagittula stellata E-37]